MNVLSLCDGMSGGQESLRQCNIPIDIYYASEIRNYSIKVTQFNFPNTIQLGNMLNWRNWNIDWGNIDLFLGGMPCQGFSIAGKKLNLDDKRSQLFLIGIDILHHIQKFNPNVKFLIENVKMKKEISQVLDDYVGIKHLYVNSKNHGSMIRKRFYWTNIPYKKETKDNKIKDLILNYTYDKPLTYLFSKTIYSPILSNDGIITINPRNKNGRQTWQRGRVYDIRGNCPTICESLYNLKITNDHKYYRELRQDELEKLQGFPKNYTSCLTLHQAGSVLGDGWNIPTINAFLKNINKKETK